MARPIWKGAINFGLVNIPIEMVTAVQEKAVHFHMLTKNGTCRLRRKLYCPETNKEYDFNETGRGIEIAPDEYVLVDQREINRLKPDKGKSMDVKQFVPLSSIDPVFYDRTYYLRPTEDSIRPYALLVEAMAKSDKCALAQFVMREKQYLVVIRVLGDGLTVHTLHYADEVHHIDEELPDKIKKTKLSASELHMASELVKSMTAPLDLESFRDEYRERLQELIDAKVKGKEMVNTYDEEADAGPKPTSLMDALKKSLASSRVNGHSHHGRAASGSSHGAVRKTRSAARRRSGPRRARR